MIVAGTVRPPGDKSITHRALILGALTRSRVTLEGALSALDTRATAAALRRLGAEVSPLRKGAPVEILGRRWRSPDGPLRCGNSGTTARLLLGALAGAPVKARLTGDASLRRRPMRRLTTPLRAMGAVIEEEAADGLPLSVSGGRLRDFSYHTPVASAQLKTALLLAGVSGGVEVTVSEPVRSRDHTERLLAHLGFDLTVRGTSVTLAGPPGGWPRIPACRLAVPGDPSSAAFLVGAAILAERGELRLQGVCVNPTRSGYLGVLQRMGGYVERAAEREVAGEPVADLLVRPAALRATEVAAREVPSLIDEVPLLAMVAARAQGLTRFQAVGELRVKESDRLALIASNLRALGVAAEAEGDDLLVEGTDRPPAGRVETAGDHRVAMALAVLGTLPGARVELSETASAAVSYPGFFEDLARIRADA